jgi:hypothetical protein
MAIHLEIRPVTNPFVMKLFARGNILAEPAQAGRIQEILYNALAEFARQESDWRPAVEYINRQLIKDRYNIRIYPAGIIPLFQYPIAVVFILTGEYCLLFELVGLENACRRLDLPIASNMSHAFFMDFLTGIFR